MFEHKTEPLVPPHVFLSRVARGLIIGFIIILFSLSVGMIGYHYIAELAWIDAFVESAMISAGMGPMAPLHSFNAKLFAGFYALYSGLALIISISVAFAPIIHRFFHAMHVETDEDEKE